jgi:hypothetical protein
MGRRRLLILGKLTVHPQLSSADLGHSMLVETPPEPAIPKQNVLPGTAYFEPVPSYPATPKDARPLDSSEFRIRTRRCCMAPLTFAPVAQPSPLGYSDRPPKV